MRTICRHALVLMLLIVGQRSAAVAGELRIVTHDLPPFTIGSTPALTGVAVDLVRAIMRRTGDTGAIQMEPFPRLMHDLQSGPETVGFVVARTPERDPLMQWVGPILVNSVYFYKKAGSSLQVQTLDDVRHLAGIGVTRGDADHMFLTEHGFTNLDVSESQSADLRKVALGRVEVTPVSQLVFPSLIEAAGLHASDFERTPVKLFDSMVYLALSRDVSAATIQAWAAALAAVKSSGEFAAILARYRITLDAGQPTRDGS
jgi:polar amino acid transport system substrate-binding protein